MKRLYLFLAALLVWGAAPLPAEAGCYICTRGSSCGQYCRYGSSDTGDKRKACRKAGCKIGGTASCPSAANVRICSGIGFRIDDKKRFASVDALLLLSRPVVAAQSYPSR